MNLQQAKAILDGVSNETAIKHPKVLIAELCNVVKFLLEEIEKPHFTVLPKRRPEDLKTGPYRTQPPWPDQPKPEFPGLPKRQISNAGDAE